MMYFKNIYILFLLILSYPLAAQKETYNWYFGENCGVTFNTGKPEALTDGALNTDEGCVTISSAEGKLLFYTDGIKVWGPDHKIMLNGDSLKGDPSSTQSGVVIPKPKAPGVYYVFTLAATAGPNGFRYSIVDLKGNGGKGAVDPNFKNIPLENNVTEKLTAVRHHNNVDIWVIAHGWNSNKFIAYLVTPTGISQTPVISEVGKIHDGASLNTQGYMKANPDGTNIALALEASNLFELFDFDNSSGIVSHPITLPVPVDSYPYGVEFSSDGSIMYGTAAGKGQIYQFNLQAGSPEKIIASTLLLGETPERKWAGALQIASDGKIYYPIYGSPYLGVIHEPNKLGADCKMENNFVSLANRNAHLGLPGFDQSYFTQDLTVKNISYFDKTKVEVGKKLILKNITFDLGKYSLKPTSFPELDQVITILKTNPQYNIQLLGHTDNIGNKSSNIELSKNRTKTVKEYLISKGISEERITFEGFGSSKPIANNQTDEGRAKNRRVEFVLVNK